MSSNDENTEFKKHIRLRLEWVMNKNDWSQTELARQTGISKSNIGRWYNQKQLISFTNIVELAKGLETSTDWLLGMTEEFSRDEHHARAMIGGDHYEQVKRSVMRNATSQLWFMYRTGDSFAWNKDDKYALKDAVNQDSFEKIRLLIADPTDNGALDQIRRRRSQPSKHREDVQDTINRTLKDFIDFATGEDTHFIDLEKPETFQRLEIVFTTYVPATVAIIADAKDDDENKDGRIVTLEANFNNSIPDAPMLDIKASEDNALFDYYRKDYLRNFQKGNEVPTSQGTGKESVIRRVKNLKTLAEALRKTRSS